MKGINEK
jgi:dual specificity tyrosine-phosphorylation-regulated kinase 2/3/4